MKSFNKSKENQTTEAIDEINVLNDTNMHMAFEFYKKKNYERAYDMLKLVAENSNNSTAQYNLGSMYAQGLGTEQDFVEAAYWFKEAFKNGEEDADKSVKKCLLDYVNNLQSEAANVIYEKLYAFAKRVYNTENYKAVFCKNLKDLGVYYFNNKKDYVMAVKLFRAGAEYANDAMCQNYLAVSYNLGAGVNKSDLAALYWFDKAAEQGNDASMKDRNGILNAYINNLGLEETKKQLQILADWCAFGKNDSVPLDAERAEYWSSLQL